MKILITGANGQLGSAALEYFTSQGHDVLGVSHADLDITSRNDVFNVVTTFQPEALINAAALTNVDQCELDITQAYAVNALAVRHLTQACEHVNAQLVHISTDFVFDGETDRPYREYDLVHPISVYGRSKLGGETEAQKYAQATVLRVSWVFGAAGSDYFSWVIKGVQDGSITSLIDDQVSSPTYTYDIVRVVEHCLTHRLAGLFHVANAGETTRLEMGQVVCDKLGIKHGLTGISSDSLNRPAPRPIYSVLNTEILSSTTGIHMRDWHDALDEMIPALKEKFA